MINSKTITVGLSIGVPTIIGLYKMLTNQSDIKNIYHKFVGIEINETNYNVAIGEAIINNKGQITDFRITKRKNGMIHEDIYKSFQQIIHFLLSNRIQSTADIKNSLINYQYIGIATFGPICLDKFSQYFGTIIAKNQKWRGIKVLQIFQTAFKEVRIGIQTDVNAAGYAQYRIGRHDVKDSLVYISVGSSVDIGVIIHGKPVHGVCHPEGGHTIVQRSINEYQNFTGVCNFHKNRTCLYGMICNKAIAQRLKINENSFAEISQDCGIWKLIGYYLAQLCLNLTLIISPQVIIIDGGIMNRRKLYDMIRQQFIQLLSGYIDLPYFSKGKIDRYIIGPTLGMDAGVKGAMIMGFQGK